MSKIKKEVGDQGEAQAAAYLHAQGYEMLERNWRWKRAEIDIIARYGDVIVFIEVKTRSYDYYGDPALSVTPAQQRRVADAANAYLIRLGHEGELRYDVISVVLRRGESAEMMHYKDAFFPGVETHFGESHQL